jgi:hypothetical protein
MRDQAELVIVGAGIMESSGAYRSDLQRALQRTGEAIYGWPQLRGAAGFRQFYIRLAASSIPLGADWVWGNGSAANLPTVYLDNLFGTAMFALGVVLRCATSRRGEPSQLTVRVMPGF